MKNKTVENIGCVSLIISTAVALVLSPIITFGLAYIGGLILKLFVGNLIANGFNILFNTTRFTSAYIPVICGTLATIGKYFKASQTNNNK